MAKFNFNISRHITGLLDDMFFPTCVDPLTFSCHNMNDMRHYAIDSQKMYCFYEQRMDEFDRIQNKDEFVIFLRRLNQELSAEVAMHYYGERRSPDKPDKRVSLLMFAVDRGFINIRTIDDFGSLSIKDASVYIYFSFLYRIAKKYHNMPETEKAYMRAKISLYLMNSCHFEHSDEFVYEQNLVTLGAIDDSSASNKLLYIKSQLREELLK